MVFLNHGQPPEQKNLYWMCVVSQVHVVLARVALPLDEPQEEVDTGIESKYVSWMASAANVPEDQVTIVDTAPGAIRSTIAFPQDNSEAIEAFEGYMGSSEFRETGSTEFGGEVDGVSAS